MEAITTTLKEFKATVLSRITASTASPSVSKNDVCGLEETERSRRLEQASQTRVDKENAANLSCLIKNQHFPVFRGNISKGYKRVTTRWEEEERRRRLTNKSESAMRRLNGNKTAYMIQALGWPFIRTKKEGGAEYIIVGQTEFLEEEERRWRTSNAYWATISKNNAALVANIMRWNNFERNPNRGIRRYMRFLESKERRYRLQPAIFYNCMQNAYNESSLIRQLASPFYIQADERSPKKDLSDVHKLEDDERKRRVRHPAEEQMARELAGIVSSSLKPQALEEAGKAQPLLDNQQQNLPAQAAKPVSLMIRQSSYTAVPQTPLVFGLTRSGARTLEEIERTRRTRDIQGQLRSQLLAKSTSAVIQQWIANAGPKSTNVALEEEEERQVRIYDRQQQSISVKNARKVSGLIAKHFLYHPSTKSYALAMEESERSRRLTSSQESVAIENARKVSTLVSASPNKATALSSAAGSTCATPFTETSQPQAQAQRASAPASARSSVTVTQTTVSQKKVVVPPAAAATRVGTPRPPAPIAVITGQQERQQQAIPLATAAPALPPKQTAPAAAFVGPIVPIPAPVAAAPITTTASARVPAPVRSVSESSSIVQEKAIVAEPRPLSSSDSSAIPQSNIALTAPVPVAPLASPAVLMPAVPLPRAPSLTSPLSSSSTPLSSTSTPGYSTFSPVAPVPQQTFLPAAAAGGPTVPADPYITGAAPLLGERERKKLSKEADRHQRKYEKDLRKAETNRMKAERAHMKGRDDKAIKLENKAEKLVLEAERQKKWASGIQNELVNNQGPSAAPATM